MRGFYEYEFLSLANILILLFHAKENFPEDAGHEKKETEDSRCGAHPPGGRVHVHLTIFFSFLDWI